MGIQTETDGAFGKTRFEDPQETLAPFNVVVRLLQAVAVHVVVAGVEVEARTFDKTFLVGGLGVDWHRYGDCNEQRIESLRETH
ncbi:hypothetical protein D3C84_824470 [compost metagenome]